VSDRPDRIEPEVAERFRKNAQDEEFLAALNAILSPHQEASYRELEERHPTLHIIGAPRSGTTLLNQLVCSCLDVGYVNHLIAAFWRAPVYGVRLSEKLLRSPPVSSFESEFGRTRGIEEPHEFGYFWSSLLGYREPLEKDREEERAIDWERVRVVLTNISEAFGRPVAYKSFYLGWHVERMLDILPRTCFVWIRRRPVDTALSLLKLRRTFLGSAEAWASFRPAEYRWLRERPYWEQVAGQVYFLERAIGRQVRAAGRNVLEVEYAELCRDPGGVLERIRSLLAENGGEVGYIASPPASFTVQTFEDATDAESRRVREAIDAAYAGALGPPDEDGR
jgi:hypothetical protein